ncbi:MAG: Dna2/Cas4 domain-containing protein, partial [Clostridia bacterium]
MWLCYYGIGQETNCENVKLGKQLDEESYMREKHNIMIDNICIDHMSNNVVYEVKKSDACEEMAINQVKFYLYSLSKKGFENMKGCILYPLQKDRKEVILEDNDVDTITKNIEIIEKIIEKKQPPEVKFKK